MFKCVSSLLAKWALKMSSLADFFPVQTSGKQMTDFLKATSKPVRQ